MDVVIKSFPDYPCPVCGKALWAQVETAAWQCQACWPVEKYPPGFRARFRSQREILAKVAKQQGFKEFNRRFLLVTHLYPPELVKYLLRECREDIMLLGWRHARNKWAKFVELPKEDACPVCGSTDWWCRPAGELGGNRRPGLWPMPPEAGRKERSW